MIYLEELPPTATREKIIEAFRVLMPSIGKIEVVVRSGEGIATVTLTDLALRKQLLALENILVSRIQLI